MKKIITNLKKIKYRRLFQITNKQTFLFIFLLLIAFCKNAEAQTCTTYTASGSWTVPAGVTTATVYCWGGGGGGGGANGNGNYGASGGGGGGGASSTNIVTVSAAQVYNYTVGAGGTAGTSAANGGNGGKTTFTGAAGTYSASGGTGGGSTATDHTAGSGGAAGTSGTGTVLSGGAGGNGFAGNNSYWCSGGGGGGAAGNSGAGSAGGNAVSGGGGGTAGTGGTGSVSSGGSGSNGVTAQGNGTSGSKPGGGGGGGSSESGAYTGGAGGAGQVIVCYSVPSIVMTNTIITIPNCPYSIGFYDSGGNGGTCSNSTSATAGDYTDNQSYTLTVNSPSGSCLSVSFSSFCTESGFDYLHVYDGSSTAASQISGSPFSGGTVPSTITSSGTSLTFQFTSDVSNHQAGWAATISCASPPTVSIADTAICAGGTATLTASGATSYTWSPGGATTSTIAVSPGSTTSYTVTGSNSGGGCTGQDVTTVTVNPSPTLTVTPTSTTICSGNTTTLTASGATGTTFSWITPPTNQTTASIAVSPTVTTTYSVVATGTINNTCTTTKTSTVTVTSTPTLSVNSPTACAGQSVTLTASGATNYTWSPGGATGTTHAVSPSSTTTYTVIGTNGGGCNDTAIAVVTVNCVQTSSTQTINLTCPATYNFYDSGGSGGNYGNNENYSVTFVAPAGSCLAAHFSSYASQNACTDFLSVYNGASTASPTVNVDGAGHNFVCDANASSLTSQTITSSGNALTFSFFSNGSTTEAGWAATITCGGTPPTVNSATICAGNTATLTASGVSSYTWSSNAGSATTATVAVTPITTTVYTVTTTASGCSNSATSTVTVCNSGGGQVVSSSNNLCPGYTTTLSIVAAYCASGYQWQSSTDNTTWSNISSATSATYTTTINTSTYYQCLLTLSGGCGTSTASAAYCQAQCQAGIANTTNVGACRGSYTQTLTLTGASCVSGYQWQSSSNGTTWSNVAGATSASAVITVTANTYYQCAITCAGGNSDISGVVYCAFQNTGSTNDDCSSPTQVPTAVLNGTWMSGFNTGCATYDTQSSCADIGCGSSLPNQWFTFTAQGPNLEIAALGDNPNFNPFISIYKGTSCGSLSLVTCFGTTGSSVVNDNNGGSGSASQFTITTGQQYYVMITQEAVCFSGCRSCSGYNAYSSSFQLQINNPPPNPPGTDCATAQIVCSNGNYGGAAQLWGTQELGNGSVADCNLSEEINSAWYVLNILQGGTLTFTLAPVDHIDDYDFAMYKGSTCSLSTPVSCNYSEFTNNNAQTGISTTEGGNGNHTNALGGQWNKDLTVSAGDVYLMYINGFTPSSSSFNFSFGGTAVLGCQLPIILPVELLTYTAFYNNDMSNVNINWSTAVEINCKSFTVDKSRDGVNYTLVGQKPGAGNSQNKKDYDMIDPNPYTGLSYYRLKQTDYNGKETYYNQIAVNVIENVVFKVIPNPVVSLAEVEYNCVSDQQAILRVFDSQGVVVSEMNFNCSAGKNKSTISFEGLAPGLYVVTLSTPTVVYKAKVIK